MNRRRYRQGQEDAHLVIVERVTRAAFGNTSSIEDRYTAIVLPTRYGKSDVIRCTAIDLYRARKISAALVLSPNRLLRDQIVATDKFGAMVARYVIEGASSLKVRALEGLPSDLYQPTANGEFLVSATIQLITEQVGLFEQWVDSMLHRHKAPVLVYIDEAHTGSEKNRWGDVVERLVKRGACACLLTATPMRADGARIPGFDFTTISETPIKQYRARPSEDSDLIFVDVYEGLSRKLALKAHHTTTFQQAWNERPSPICRISRLPFDVNLKEVSGDGSSPVFLSELKPTAVRQELGRITRSPVVIRAGVTHLVQQIKVVRELKSDVAAIVFVGNDMDTTNGVDEHAKLVRSHIEAADSALEVVIATASDGNEGVEKIKRFASGRGDVLIVKQMASLGLDVPRLKVALDLSPIRTPAAYIQRVMRVATPYPPAEVCVLIVPDDCLNRALFDTLVKDAGGEAKADELELVRTYTKDREQGYERSLFVVDGVSGSDFDDSHGIKAAAEMRPDVDRVLVAFPQLMAIMTHAQVAQQLVSSGLVIGYRQEMPVNTGDVIADIRSSVHLEADAVVRHRYWSLYGNYDPIAWRQVEREAWNEAKAIAGVSLSKEFKDIADIETLKAVVAAWARMRGQIAVVE